MVTMAHNANQKTGYKQTEVGVIPKDWKIEKLGSCILGTPQYGINAPSVPYEDLLPTYIRITDITEESQFSPENIVSVRHASSGNYILNPGDLVFARTGASVGKTYLCKPEDGELVFAGYLIRVKVNPTKLLPDYLAAYVKTEYYWNWVRVMSMRSGQPGINGNEYAQLPIPLPSPKEQTAIATALSDVDALIASLDKLIAKKRDIKQATMQQLLTGKRRLPGFSKEFRQSFKQTEIGLIPADWNIHSVEEIADVTTGNKDTQDKVESGAYPFFVRSQTVERINSYSYDGEAVLTAGDGVGVGKVFHYATGKFDFHQRVYMIYNFRNFDGLFFSLYFSNHFYKEATKYNAKNSVDSVRREMITGMKIPYPPLPEQQAIATVLSDMDAEIVALERRRDKTRALKQGMMQELLTGKTRLI